MGKMWNVYNPCLIYIPWLAPWNVYFQHLNPLNVYIPQFNYGMYTFHGLAIECIHSMVLIIECIHSTVIYIQCNIYMHYINIRSKFCSVLCFKELYILTIKHLSICAGQLVPILLSCILQLQKICTGSLYCVGTDIYRLCHSWVMQLAIIEWWGFCNKAVFWK